MFFSRPGQYEPCGMYSIGHFILLGITLICVAVALYFTRNISKEKTKKVIKYSVIFLWILEIIKISFNIAIGNINTPNNYVPLYYCSLILYAGIFSAFCKGKAKKIGDVFLATGAIIGGLVFLISPTTSLPAYQMFHYISIQSFVFHGTMLYLGVLVNVTNYVELKFKDIWYYAILVTVISIISLIVNRRLGTNFMFISNNFPNTPIEPVYNFTGVMFTPFMILIQVIGPFCVMYGIVKLIHKIKDKRRGEQE